MNITCPSCAAEYEVPESRLKPGRAVRCARCGASWQPAAAPIPEAEPLTTEVAADSGAVVVAAPAESTDAAAEPAPSMPFLTAMDRLAAAPARPGRDIRLIGAWLLSLLLLASAVAATLTWRQPIVRFWPPAGRILGSAGDLPAKSDADHSNKPQ